MNFGYRNFLRLLALVLALSAMAAAGTITGTVKNATRGKPSAGDDVVLIKLQGGMQEAARTKTDSSGHFKLQTDGEGPFLVRVVHDQVNYHQPAPPGTTNVNVEVYDDGATEQDLSATVYDIAMQAQPGTLQVQEVYAVSNNSKPPRTFMNADQTFKLRLPQNAQLDDSLVSGPGGMPIKSAPVPGGKPGEYAFIYPIRPGQTTFTVLYHVPYSGSFSFNPQPQYRFQHFAVEVPKAMQLKPGSDRFKVMPEKDGVVSALVTDAKPGDDLKFDVAGTGDFPRDTQTADEAASGAAGQRPGGGIGTPEGTPDPLKQYRWYILGGIAVLLVAGGVYVVRRPGSLHSAAAASSNGSRLPSSAAPSANRSSNLLEVLKEELFQLEVDHHQGQLTDAEYERVKAALNVVIARAVTRNAQKTSA
jgi:hypothetical protein